MTTLNELGLEAAWTRATPGATDAPDGATDGATYQGKSGVQVHRFTDGATAILIGDASDPKLRTAMHLSPAQSRQLADALRVLHAAAEPPSILDEARSIVYGDRERTHGAPDSNLVAIAAIWSALLRDQLREAQTVTPQIVCLMMAGLKLARASNRPSHREHVLDTVGYMALMERCGWIDPK